MGLGTCARSLNQIGQPSTVVMPDASSAARLSSRSAAALSISARRAAVVSAARTSVPAAGVQRPPMNDAAAPADQGQGDGG